MMIPGGGVTGACYLVTPDGRRGWAYDFLNRGYRVVLPDWSGVGRSGAVPMAELGGARVCRGLGEILETLGGNTIVLTHSMSGAFGWKLVEDYGHLIDRVVGTAPAPPGNVGPPLAKLVKDRGAVKDLQFEWAAVSLDTAGFVLLDEKAITRKVGEHSVQFPPEGFKRIALTNREVGGRLLYERTNIANAQLRIEKFENFRDKRLLVITGTDDIDHSRTVDNAIVEFLLAHGAKAEFLYLGDVGVKGNSHMLMSDRNSSEVAGIIMKWLES
jgi:pimeloyl-ACP methyl ester carboxylesterase